MVTKCSFDATTNILDYYRGIDCIKELCKKLKKHAIEIINCEEKEMIPLTEKETKSYEVQQLCHICKKQFCFEKNEGSEFKLYRKVRDHCHYTKKFREAAHSICNLKYKVSKKFQQ